MKVVIAGGNNEAEFIVGMFHNGKNQVIVINSSKEVVDKISKRKKLCVYHGDPWKKYCLEEADAFSADVFISLCPVDTDNFATCLMAKKCFNAQRTLCLVTNPINVELYKEFGIDSVISSPYLLGRTIQEEASLENIMRTISLENDQLKVIEAPVFSSYKICGLTLKEARFPGYCSISAVFRTPEVIIAKGDTRIEAKDTLFLVCKPSDEAKVMAFITKPKDAKTPAVRAKEAKKPAAKKAEPKKAPAKKGATKTEK